MNSAVSCCWRVSHEIGKIRRNFGNGRHGAVSRIDTCLFSVRVSPFWCPFTHAHASQVQRFSRRLVSCSARVYFQSGCYLLWCFITHSHASQAQRFSRWLVSRSARFLFLSSVLPFLEPLPFYSALLYISTFCLALCLTVGPRINPYQRHLSPNHQSSIINHQPSITRCQSRGVDWSIASLAAFVMNSNIFDPLPDFLVS